MKKKSLTLSSSVTIFNIKLNNILSLSVRTQMKLNCVC